MFGFAASVMALWLLFGAGYSTVDMQTGAAARSGPYWPALIPAGIAGLVAIGLTRRRKGLVMTSAVLMMLVGVLFVFSFGIPFFVLGALLLLSAWTL